MAFCHHVHQAVSLCFLPALLASNPSSPPLSALQYVPPDLCICNFVLEQSLSVRALQEMLANTGQSSEGVSASFFSSFRSYCSAETTPSIH